MSTLLKKFITSCSLTFKAFDHEIVMSQSKSTLWNFTAHHYQNEKNYAVYCAPKINSAKALIKVALKKVPKDTRLVVVTSSYTPEEKVQADREGYALVTLDKLSQYGTEMIEIKEREKALQAS